MAKFKFPTAPSGLLKGKRPDIMGSNVRTMKAKGQSEADATRTAIQASSFSESKPKGHPNRHKNLGTFLHKGKKKA